MLDEYTKLSVAFAHTHTHIYITGLDYMACYPALI